MGEQKILAVTTSIEGTRYVGYGHGALSLLRRKWSY